MKTISIENVAARMVTLRLNSGRTLLIGSGLRSGEIPVEEIEGNPLVRKLLDRRLIAVFPAARPKPAKGAKKKSAEPTSTKKKPKAKGGKK
jgi:hypothetical protein